MDDREERLKAGKEMLKKFQASKQQVRGGDGKADTPSPPPLQQQQVQPQPYSQAAAVHDPPASSGVRHPPDYSQQQHRIPTPTSFRISQTVRQHETLGDYFGQDKVSFLSPETELLEPTVEIVLPLEEEEEEEPVIAEKQGMPLQQQQTPLTAPAVKSLSDEINGVLTSVDLNKVEDSEVIERSQMSQLERRNAELEEQLQVHRATLHQYQAQVLASTSQLQEAHIALDREKLEKEQRFNDETLKLRSELSSHKDTIQMLVSEKTDFEHMVKRVETSLRNKEAEAVSLAQRLEVALAAASKQESVLQTKSEQGFEKTAQEKQVALLQQQLCDNQIILGDQKHESAELKEKLAMKEQESRQLKEELTKKSSRLELAEVNLAQLRSASSLTNSPESDGNALKDAAAEITSLKTTNADLVKRESELTAYIQQASHDREQIIHQYTTYCKQLTGQIESVSRQLNEKIQEANVLSARETELVHHVEQLESQLQKLIQQRQQQPASTTSNGDMDRKELAMLRHQMADLDARLSEALLERNEWQGKCHEKDEEAQVIKLVLLQKESMLSDLETRNEMLKSTSFNGHSQDLVAACESDKVAASRAMAQNKQLKEQVEELECAIISLTNSKADLELELDTLRRKRDSSSESETARKLEVSALQDAVRDRDRIIIQMKEQMKHYVAFAENSINGHSSDHDDEDYEETARLRDQLEEAKEQIRCLGSHNSELRSQIEVLSSPTRETSGSPRDNTPAMSTMSEEDSLTSEASTTEDATAVATDHLGRHVADSGNNGGQLLPQQQNVARAQDDHRRTHTVEHQRTGGVPVISHDVAFIKLEQKFFEAMNRIADLLSEKEQLEHLTVQLQEETETVGEYITIYQYQRQQIKQRMEEKESQLQAVSREREELKSKLSQLQNLVTHFLQEKRIARGPQEDVERSEMQERNGNDVLEMAEEATPENISEGAAAPALTPRAKAGERQTAEKIMALLSEIGANQMLHEEFHPWFWEQGSGRLMTV